MPSKTFCPISVLASCAILSLVCLAWISLISFSFLSLTLLSFNLQPLCFLKLLLLHFFPLALNCSFLLGIVVFLQPLLPFFNDLMSGKEALVVSNLALVISLCDSLP